MLSYTDLKIKIVEKTKNKSHLESTVYTLLLLVRFIHFVYKKTGIFENDNQLLSLFDIEI